jgi:hypothetical protein
MSILPYGDVSIFGWTSAYGMSVVLHGAAAFGILGGFGGWLTPEPEPPESAPFMISFAPLETAPVEPVELPPDPVEETPTALEPETVAPTLAEAETVQPVAPEALEAEVVTSAVETAEPRPMLPLGPEAGGGGEAAVAVPEAPASATEQDLALADWIERLRTSAPPACLAALLRREGETGIGLAFVASDPSAMAAYADSLLGNGGLQPTVSRVLVDPRQCPALDFLRAHADYPATRLGLSLETPIVQSGERMTGFVRGAAGRQLTLLLVDDNGVVQNLNRFLSFSGNLARFEVPVTREGPTRATGQILIAIATRGQPGELTARAGQLAEDVFVGLPRDLSESALLALATVEVR